jgi:hypothetical protein
LATAEQYEFFRFLYEEEERRYLHLESRAKLYLSIIALFIATLVLKAQDVQASVAVLKVPWLLILLQAILLASSLVFVVLSVFIRTYEGVADPEQVIEGFGEEAPSNEDFFDDRIADYVVATGRNAAVNDRCARFLEIAVYLLSAAMLLLFLTFLVALLK